MKILLGAALAVFAATSCESKTTTTDNNMTAVVDTPPPAPVVTMDTPSGTYVAKEGDVMLKDGQVVVYSNAAWVPASGDTKLKNGVWVAKDGKVKSDNKEIMLSEGERVDADGNFWDDAGNAVADGWDATKKGASKAGQGIAKGAEKAGEAIATGAKKTGEAVSKGAQKTKEFVTGKDN